MASFGENLRRERELRGVSLREVAEATKISLRFLEAFEKDRIDLLPGGLFQRAFVRQYAQFLGLDAEKTVSEFLYEHGETGLEKPPPPPPASPSIPRGLLVFVAVAVAAGVLTWKRLDRRETAGAAPVAPLPAVIQPTDRVYPPPSSLREEATITPAYAPGSITLSLTAQQDCWVMAEADGQTVINRVLSSGETQTFEAIGQIVLSVGNAGGVVLKVNDHPGVSLGKNGEVRRNIVINKESLPSFVREKEERPALSSRSS